MSFQAFRAETSRLADVLCALNLLQWDARTMLPPGGVGTRAEQISTLTAIAREIATGQGLARAIADARDALAGETGEAAEDRRREVEFAASGIEALGRIPARLVAEGAALKTVANAAWIEARAKDDFAALAPFLEKTVALQREVASSLGYERHPYDALLGAYEPGMTLARLGPLFARLRAELSSLADLARGGLTGPSLDFRALRFPVEAQKRFAATVAAEMGYDFARGRLDDTVHPFEVSMTRGDVRIAGRFREDWLPGGLFAVWHEGGHGIYEQNVAEERTRSAFAIDFVNLYAVGGASFGLHESQSRLYENRVGRSRRFWELNYGRLRDAFPDQLAGVSGEAFWRAVNEVRPSLIRVEADEATYDLHIVLRVELEAALIAGEIAVRDLPGLWRERTREFLGLDVPSDREGVLQDVHWSSGMIGSFATYTLGNVMAAQIFEAANRDEAVSGGLERGDCSALTRWLGSHVHRHGRRFATDEILARATGSALDPDPYLRTLRAKIGEVYAAA